MSIRSRLTHQLWIVNEVVVDLFHRYLKQDYFYNDLGIETEGGAWIIFK